MKFKLKYIMEVEQEGENFIDAVTKFDSNLMSIDETLGLNFKTGKLVEHFEIKENNLAPVRTYCKDISLKDALMNNKIFVSGFINSIRDIGGILFITLRDNTGIIQCVIENNETNNKLYEQLKTLSKESSATIHGIVNERKDANDKIKNGNIEIIINNVEIHNIAEPLPFQFNIK